MEPKEYFEGREAFKRGIVDCPYLDRQQYLDWNRGWWDEANECAKESR